MIPTGETEPAEAVSGELGSRDFDDAFAGVDAGTRFTLSGAGRGLAVTFESGYGYAQLFAPPGQELICFEPMTAPTNALASGRGLGVLAPGESHTGAFSIAVE